MEIVAFERTLTNEQHQTVTPTEFSRTWGHFLGPNRWWKSEKSSFEENTPKTQHVPSFSQSKLFYERNMNQHTLEGPFRLYAHV